MTKTLTFRQTARLLKVGEPCFCAIWRRLEDFPAPIVTPKKTYIFLQAAVEAWAKGKDVPALARAIKQQLRDESPLSPSVQKAVALGKRFAAGEFATDEQKAQFAMRRMTARLRQPQTTRVTLAPDWMRDDRSTHER